jgi:AhpD family alkylhydroperoxidase
VSGCWWAALEIKGSPITTNPRLEVQAMQARIENPALTLPGAMQALRRLADAAKRSGVSQATRNLVVLRASQINGCSVCVDMHSRELKAAGEPDERISTLAAWRDSSYFTDAERSALALTEAATRLADRSDPVPDEVWAEAARHYNEQELTGLVVSIAATNAWNRINAATRQITGEWVGEWVNASTGAAQAA